MIFTFIFYYRSSRFSTDKTCTAQAKSFNSQKFAHNLYEICYTKHHIRTFYHHISGEFSMNSAYQRINWVDIAKGITIILVVAGHTISYGNSGPIIKTIIFSFHMPFFFIMSGYTASLPTSTEEFWQKTKRISLSLLVPSYSAYICKTLILALINRSGLDLSFLINQLYSLLFIDSGKTNFHNFITSSFGYVWFLPVLFFGRTLFSYLNLIFKKQELFLVICILSLMGYICGKQQNHLILGLDIVLTVLPFLFFGNCMKEKFSFSKPLQYIFIFLLIWIFSFIIIYPNPQNDMYLDLWERNYPLYPLCFFTAIAGTIFLCHLSVLLSNLRISQFFALIGKHSLIFYLIHYFDTLWESIWKSFSDQYIRFGIRLVIDTIIFLIFMLILLVFKKSRSNRAGKIITG